jgi:hypothetical protein
LNSYKKKTVIQNAILIFNIVAVGLFLFAILNRNYPIIGHDYTYFLSRLFDTELHYRINGLSIQWYTPSFGGGLPAYANPQQAQFSLPQILTLLFNPWDSYLFSITIYATVGILCFYIFSREILNLDWRASLLGALFFVFTGFYIGHMIAGQLGFLGFPLLSGVMLVLFWKRCPDLLAGIVIALLISSLIYHAGFYTLVIFVLSSGITLPMLYIINPQIFSFASLFKRLTISGVFFVALSLSKVYAIYTFMRYFQREITYEYSSEYLSTPLLAIMSFFAQLLGTTTIAPLMVVTGQDINSLPRILSYLSGYTYSGLWETDNAVSPALICIFFFAALRHIRAKKKVNLSSLPKDKLVALLLVILATWLALEYTLAKGWLYSLISQLPVFKSLHINFRFTSVFFFPLATSGALITHQWLQEQNHKNAWTWFILLNIITLASPLSYFLYTDDVHYRMFDATNLLTAYQQSKEGETFPVKYVTDKDIKDWNVFPLGATTILPYEAVFGYDLRAFTPQIHPGLIFEVTDGYFNMTNPASLTFPLKNGGKVFSLFEETDQGRLELFIQRRQPNWNIPIIQIVFNYISAISFFASLAVIFFNILPLSKLISVFSKQ